MVEMRHAAPEEWAYITDEEMAKIVDTMPDRVEAMVAADGGLTHDKESVFFAREVCSPLTLFF
jgi:hypothetical protein